MFMADKERVTTQKVSIVAPNLRRSFQRRKRMKLMRVLRIIFGLLVLASFAHAQDGFFTSWEDRARATLAAQPAWPTPVVTANAGLVQLFRADFVRQITPSEITTWNYGNSKGVDLIPWYKTEFDITIPPYIEHNSPKLEDGFGDVSMLLKYRILADGEAHAYSMSFSAGGTIPTGNHTNGSTVGNDFPDLLWRKGFPATRCADQRGRNSTHRAHRQAGTAGSLERSSAVPGRQNLLARD